MLDRLLEQDERVTTTAVIEELREGVSAHPELQDVIDLPWLRVKNLANLKELRFFAEYARRLGSGMHDIGEATILAWAEANGATAFTDDDVAVQIGRERGVNVVRTLALVARGVRHGLLTESEADRLVDELLRAGGRFPFRPGEFILWARDQGLF
jgi:predicted nucleic acid-binding protein